MAPEGPMLDMSGLDSLSTQPLVKNTSFRTYSHTRCRLADSLEQVDITDSINQAWFDKYKYDIPVLHLEGKFWIKHRMTVEQAMDGFDEVIAGTFQGKPGEPSAAAMERNNP